MCASGKAKWKAFGSIPANILPLALTVSPLYPLSDVAAQYMH